MLGEMSSDITPQQEEEKEEEKEEERERGLQIIASWFRPKVANVAISAFYGHCIALALPGLLLLLLVAIA